MPHHPIPKKIIRRNHADSPHLAHLHPLLRRIYLARELSDPEHLERSLSKLPSPWLMSGMETLVAALIEAIRNDRHIVIIADFDADGATSCAVALLGLRAMGAKRVGYLVPNRFEFGYGLTPEIVAVAAESRPDMLITVDNGIASLDGVRAARDQGITVLVTDHHLPGEELPAAHAIVNPNLPDDGFPSKTLAGVGVMFYVLMALRAKLRDEGWFTQSSLPEPNLGQLLDLVALGTVADVVPLDHVNRILVHQGLQRIRSGQARPGIVALLEVANRSPKSAGAGDLGFVVGPRLNAAGRLEDMSLGIECLMAEDTATARALAAQLDGLNRDRREIEDQMKLDAHAMLESLASQSGNQDRAGWCFFDDSWHQGVIGILASRMKDRLHRPVIAFAPASPGEIKGSARSITGVHIRDVLSDIAAAYPRLLSKFGGHAMAAGLSLKREGLRQFVEVFDSEVAKRLAGLELDQVLHSDGELAYQDIRMDNAEMLQQAGPWGQNFPEPLFDGEFEVLQCRIVGEKHLKWLLQTVKGKRMVDAISFFVDEPTDWLGCKHLKMAYRLDINEYRDNRTLQLRIEYMEGH